MKLALAFGIGIMAVGCSASPGSQVISGQVDHTSFGGAVDRVTITQAGNLVVAAPVNADGTFKITVPAGSNYHLNLSTPALRAGLINPRPTGTIDVTFAVRGHGADFNLGTVRLIGDATSHGYKYGKSSGGATDGECENGIDATTGAVCVDDQGDGATCDAQDGEHAGEGSDAGSGDGETADGSDNGSGGDETADDTGEASDANNDGMPDAAAVADHNLPPTMGCDDGSDHQHDGEEQGDH